MKWIAIISLFITSTCFGQDTITRLDVSKLIDSERIHPPVRWAINGRVENLTMSNDFSRISDFNLRSHTFLKPEVLMVKSSNHIKSKTANLSPLVDLNGFISQSENTTTENRIGFRVGAGASWDAFYNNKWHIKLNAVQGIYSGDSAYRPKSYFNWKEGNSNLYSDIRSRISYTPNHIFNFQAGIDHNFYGEGSRSLFLSDMGNPYPFGLIRTRFWRLEYSILYQFFREGGQNNWNGKFASTHHISFNAAKWLNLGIFETVIFNPSDTLLNRGFDVEYLNPIVFYRPQEYSVGSSDNVLLGVDVTAKFKNYTLYSQFILDEFLLSEIRARSQWWANKFGGQFGAKAYFQLQRWRLFTRVELNFVRPYTYAHLNEQLNYGNQGMPLAHPYGSNFAEILGEVNLQKGNYSIYGFLSYTLRGSNTNGANYGGNVYDPYINRPYEYGHFIGQGSQDNRWLLRVMAERRFPKFYNTSLFVEANLNYSIQTEKAGGLVLLGVRKKLWNDYRNY